MDFSFLSGILTSSWNLLLNLVDIAIVATSYIEFWG